eukprot:TRINITY_DN18428_c0_g1_i3.p1 TRINITY_DN18428_c0_g1~~TRINITY_DN18428_c0_g1_i3.p1  ORF type:complete len:107 (+),score=9.00 TRINITY_DN18428_c0_g1_i3:153-473(+)
MLGMCLSDRYQDSTDSVLPPQSISDHHLPLEFIISNPFAEPCSISSLVCLCFPAARATAICGLYLRSCLLSMAATAPGSTSPLASALATRLCLSWSAMISLSLIHI